jgi:hypothetical protein
MLSLPPKRANKAMEASTMRAALETTQVRRRNRAIHMVEASIALFARFADDRGIDELLSMLA